MLDLETAKKIYENIYQDVNGYILSAQARKKLNYHDKSHTYGEVTPDSFYKILSKVEPKEGEIFYDLGSGTGKAVVLASLLFEFSKCVGIEILKDLYDTARAISVRLESEIEAGRREFRNCDFLTEDFFDADIVFAHSTCFYDELWSNLEKKLEKLKSGTKVITVTKTIDSSEFVFLATEEHQMGWGRATINYYKKI